MAKTFTTVSVCFSRLARCSSPTSFSSSFSQGIGSNFVDGNPNIKYLPQRPIELHEILPSQPPPASPPPKAAVRRRPAAPAATASSIPERPKTASAAVGMASESAIAHDELQASVTPNAQNPSLMIRHVRQPTTEDNGERPVVPGQLLATTGAACGRPRSSPAAHSGFAVGNGEGRDAHPPSVPRSPTRSPTRHGVSKEEVLRGGRAKVEENKPKPPQSKRPQTADGRDIEATKHKDPHLDDPGDPVMIAHR